MNVLPSPGRLQRRTVPPWAAKYPSKFGSPPRSNAAYAGFVRELVRRYGPRGSFWAENPGLPYRLMAKSSMSVPPWMSPW